MSEEYLWDKSGEPDPEIQQLEDILGTLKYQPKSLELPENIRPGRRSQYLPLVAIAATLLMALIAGALWLSTKTDEPRQQNAEITPSATPSSVPSPEAPRKTDQDQFVVNPKAESHSQREAVANNSRRRPRPSLSEAERRRALEAKEQLMVALRLASEKLNIVQRKTQGPASPSQIKNQHKVG
jgi:hypothetical protein